MSEQEQRPCHKCEKPRGTSYTNPALYPGMLLCASCAGVLDVRAVLIALRDGVAADGTFERLKALARINELLGLVKP